MQSWWSYPTCSCKALPHSAVFWQAAMQTKSHWTHPVSILPPTTVSSHVSVSAEAHIYNKMTLKLWWKLQTDYLRKSWSSFTHFSFNSLGWRLISVTASRSVGKTIKCSYLNKLGETTSNYTFFYKKCILITYILTNNYLLINLAFKSWGQKDFVLKKLILFQPGCFK